MTSKNSNEHDDYFCNYLGTHDSSKRKYWLNTECCGVFCSFTTDLLILYGMYATTNYVIIPWMDYSVYCWIHIILFNSCCLLAMYSHFAAMTTDPGSVPNIANPLPDDEEENDFELGNNHVNPFKKFCKRCQAFKPARAHHCSICARCIVKMDHHCPWVNNCIGINNHKLFLLFIFWVFVVSAYSLTLVVAKYATCMMMSWGCINRANISDQLYVVFLVVEAVLFGLFTLCMMADQIGVLTTNQTKIDRLKNLHNSSSSSGSGYSIHDTVTASMQKSKPSSNLVLCGISNPCSEAIFATNSNLNGVNTNVPLPSPGGLDDNASDVSSNAENIEINEIFGGSLYTRCRLSWFVPTAVHFPKGLRDKILGYTTLSNKIIQMDSSPAGNDESSPNDTDNYRSHQRDGLMLDSSNIGDLESGLNDSSPLLSRDRSSLSDNHLPSRSIELESLATEKMNYDDNNLRKRIS